MLGPGRFGKPSASWSQHLTRPAAASRITSSPIKSAFRMTARTIQSSQCRSRGRGVNPSWRTEPGYRAHQVSPGSTRPSHLTMGGASGISHSSGAGSLRAVQGRTADCADASAPGRSESPNPTRRLCSRLSGHNARGGIRLDDLVLSYSQLTDAAGRVTSLLSSLGVAPADRVGVMLPNVPAFPIAFYGALGAGAVVVPFNSLGRSREVAHYVGDSGAKVLFAWHQAAAEAAKGAAGTGAQVVEVDEPDLHTLLAGLAPALSLADPAGDDDAVILYTSGTTGTPKGAELTHANLTRNAELAAATMLDIRH